MTTIWHDLARWRRVIPSDYAALNDDELLAALMTQRGDLNHERRPIITCINDGLKEALTDSPLVVPELPESVKMDSQHLPDQLFLAAGIVDQLQEKPLSIRYIGANLKTYNAWTESERKALLGAWADRVFLWHFAAAEFMGHAYDLSNKIAGRIPVHDNSGTLLTGETALAERLRLYNNDYKTIRNRSISEWAELIRSFTRPADALPTQLPRAKSVLIDRLRRHHAGRRSYILDAELHEEMDAGTQEQADALRSLSLIAQNAQRLIRDAATVASAASRFERGKTDLNDVFVENRPIWKKRGVPFGTIDLNSDRGAADAPISHTEPFDPSAKTWSYQITAENVTTLSAAPAISIESEEPSGLWNVAIVQKSNSRDKIVTITRSGAGTPVRGARYPITLLARNAYGPEILNLTLRVLGEGG